MQCVAINGYTSGLLHVLSGVSQGSILGPLLFLLFINDLPQSVRSSSMLLFADDVKGGGHAKNFFLNFIIKLNWICSTCCKKEEKKIRRCFHGEKRC